MGKINILYYDPTSGYGGSSRCLLGWLRKLDCNNYNPIVIVHYNGPAIQKMRETGVKVITIPWKYEILKAHFMLISYLMLFVNFVVFDIPTAIYLYIYIKKCNIKVIHLNAKVISVIPGIIAAGLARVPCICHLHDIKVPIKREKFFARWVDCFFVLTKKAYELYEREYPGKRLELVQNGIDLEDYKICVDKNRLRKEFDIKNNEIIVGIVGRLVEGKGFSDFIKAASIISSKKENVKFIIMGSAAKQEDVYEIFLKNLVKELLLEKKLIFAGWREDVKQIISIFDILVQASSTFPEGFGLTVIEAMALSKPVIVTNIPGPSELIIDGETGFIISPAKPEELAKAIICLINAPALAIKMGNVGRTRVKEVFDVTKITRQIENIYKNILRK